MLYQIDMNIKIEDTCFSYINNAKNNGCSLEVVFLITDLQNKDQ